MLLEINCIKNYLTYDFLTNCIEVAWYILMLSYYKKVEATTASTRLTTFFALFICFILNDILQSICFWIFSSKLWITFENKYLLVHTWRIHAVQKRYLWRISLASIMLWYYHITNRNNFAPHKKSEAKQFRNIFGRMRTTWNRTRKQKKITFSNESSISLSAQLKWPSFQPF